MRASVRKWGNSSAVRIPAEVLKAASLRLDQEVDVREEGGRVVIEAARPAPADRLDELIAALDPATFHDEVDFGPPVGREIW